MNRLLTWLIFTISFASLCYFLEAAITPFFVAFLIAYLIHPLVQKIESKVHNKSLIIAIIIIAIMCSCFAVLSVIIPLAYEQTSLLISKIPAYKAYLQPIVTEKVSHLNPEIASRLSTALHSAFDSTVMIMANGINNILGYFLATVSTIVMIFIIPVILFYLLRDLPSCRASIERLFKEPHRSKVSRILAEIHMLLSAYIGGQLKVCFIMSIYYATGLSIIGLDLSLLLGAVSGLLIILPFVGFLLSAITALIFSYITFGFSYAMLAVAGLYTAGSILEGAFLTPKIIGDKIGLHPLWIIFAVLAGGTLFGVFGMLFAIPVAGICKILLKAFLESHK